MNPSKIHSSTNLTEKEVVPAASTRILPVDLLALDNLSADAMALFCWEDIRPLKGVLGLVDWRVCGAISRAIETEMFHGVVGETLLLPAPKRLGVGNLFVFGLGLRAQWSPEKFAQACAHAQHVLSQAQSLHACWSTPACLGDVRVEQTFVQLATQQFGAQIDLMLVERV